VSEANDGLGRDVRFRRQLTIGPSEIAPPYDFGFQLRHYVIGARRQDAMFIDVFLREVLRSFYFDGEPVSDATLSQFAEQRWGPYQGYAWLYLSTNTEVWARSLGVAFRLRSGALSDPDAL
jgi:hypothetical protein